jgi:hypothetical protein
MATASIIGSVFIASDKGFYMLGRDEFYSMPILLKGSSLVVGRVTSLHDYSGRA